jgi:hypothetical protein
MAWVYEQPTGRLFNPAGLLISIGYSGAIGYKNNPQYQNVAFKGPIPCGLYTVGAPVDDLQCGAYCLPLTPDPTNEMFGRNEFKMHGDNRAMPGTASEGCIVQPLFARQRLWESGDCTLQVVELLHYGPISST